MNTQQWRVNPENPYTVLNQEGRKICECNNPRDALTISMLPDMLRVIEFIDCVDEVAGVPVGVYASIDGIRKTLRESF
jgi:hypothetical protein